MELKLNHEVDLELQLDITVIKDAITVWLTPKGRQPKAYVFRKVEGTSVAEFVDSTISFAALDRIEAAINEGVPHANDDSTPPAGGSSLSPAEVPND